MKMQITRIKLPVIIFLTLGFFSFAEAQVKSSLQESMKKVDGDIEKVTIKTSTGEVILSGDDAKEAVNRLKGEHKYMKMKMHNFDDDKTGNKVIIINDDTLDIAKMKERMPSPEKMKELMEMVKVVNEGGTITVNITSSEDGKESVKVLKGEEAEKWLKEHKDDNADCCKEGKADTKNKEHKVIIIEKDLKTKKDK